MATGNAIDFEYFTYTADDASAWSVKVDKTWGAAAASGLGAYDAANPVFPRTARYRPRMVALQDPVSGRRTTRVAGAADATILVPGTTTVTSARGATGSYTLTSLGVIPEKRPKTAVIVSKAEPITT